MLKLGYAQRPITPDFSRPIFLAGRQQNRRAQSVRDDLWVRALSLTHGTTQVVILTLDLVGLERPHCREIEDRVQAHMGEQVQLLVASSHTPFAPDTIGHWGPDPTESGVDPDYLTALKGRAVLAAIEALQSDPVDVGVYVAATGDERHNAHKVNARAMIQFSRPDGDTQATLLIAPHTPPSQDETVVSAGMVAQLRDRVEAKTGAPALFLFSAKPGNEAVSLLSLDDRQPQPDVALSYTRRTLSLSPESVTVCADVAGRRDATGQVLTEVGLLQLGDVWLAALPGTLSTDASREIQAMMREHGATTTAVIGLANDTLCAPESPSVVVDVPPLSALRDLIRARDALG